MTIERQAFFDVMASFPSGVGDRDHARRRRDAPRADHDRRLQRLRRPADRARLRRPRLADARRAACAPGVRRQLRRRGAERALPALRLEGGGQVRRRRVAADGQRASAAPRGRARVGRVHDGPRARDRRPRRPRRRGRGRRRAAGARAAAPVLPSLVGCLVAGARGRPSPMPSRSPRSKSAAATSAGRVPSTDLSASRNPPSGFLPGGSLACGGGRSLKASRFGAALPRRVFRAAV